MLSSEQDEEKGGETLDRNFQSSTATDLDILEDTVGLYIDRLSYLKSKITSFRESAEESEQEEEERQGYLTELFQLTKNNKRAYSFDLFHLQEGYKDSAKLLSSALKERDELRLELEHLKPQHDEVHGKLRETDSELQILQEENEQLRIELEAKEKAFSNLEIQKDSLDKQRIRLEGDLAVLKKEKYDLTTTFLNQTDEDLREEILVLKDQLKLEKTKRSSLQLRIQRLGKNEPKVAGSKLVNVSLEDVCAMAEEQLLEFTVSNLERDIQSESSSEEGAEDKRLRLKREAMRVFSRFLYQLSSDQMGILFYLLQRIDAGEELEEVQRTFHVVNKERVLSSPKPVIISHVSRQERRDMKGDAERKGVLDLEVRELEDEAEEGDFTASSFFSSQRPMDPIEALDPLDDESFQQHSHSSTEDLAPPVSPSATEKKEQVMNEAKSSSRAWSMKTSREESFSPTKLKKRPQRAPPSAPEEEEAEQLPSHWESFVDDSSGEVYYHNFVTGETTWDPPKQAKRSGKKKKKKGKSTGRSRSNSFSYHHSSESREGSKGTLFHPTASSSSKSMNPSFVYENSLAESSSSMMLFDRETPVKSSRKMRRSRSFNAGSRRIEPDNVDAIKEQPSSRARNFTTYKQEY